MKAFIVFLFFCTATFASKFYMLDYQMQNLYSKKVVDLNTFKGKKLFLTFIKSDCKWCDKQLSTFKNIMSGEHANEVEVVIIALGNDIEILKKKTEEVSFPVLIASQHFLKSIGGVNMTPYTLITDKNGNFETKIVGYQSKNQIESIIHKLEGKK